MTNRTSDLDTREIRYFVAVAADLSFKTAAERLGVSQSTLSQAMSRLEHHLGTALFARGKRRAPELTPSGRILFAEARGLLEHVDNITALVADDPSETIPLKISSFSSTFAGLVPLVIPRLRKRSPKTKVSLVSVDESALETAILHSRVDVGFARVLRGPRGVKYTFLADEPLVAVLHHEHPLAERDTVALAELAEEPFVLFHRDDAIPHYDAILSACLRAGFSPNIQSYSRDDISTLATVACGLGASVMPLQSSFHPFRNVVYVPLSDTGAVTPLAALGHPDIDVPAATELLAIVHDEIAAIAARDTAAGRPTFSRIGGA
jgi:DNA-binding transcriptional LysR family regulator